MGKRRLYFDEFKLASESASAGRDSIEGGGGATGRLAIDDDSSLTERLPGEREALENGVGVLDLDRVDRDLLLADAEELKVVVRARVARRLAVRRLVANEVHFAVALHLHAHVVACVLPVHFALHYVHQVLQIEQHTCLFNFGSHEKNKIKTF